jgi:nucleoside-diphosphate-sugar epimerase
MQPSGVQRMCADISRAHAYLLFKPSISLREGLQRILKLDTRYTTG